MTALERAKPKRRTLGEGIAYFHWVSQWWRAATTRHVRQCRKEWNRGEL